MFLKQNAMCGLLINNVPVIYTNAALEHNYLCKAPID